MNPEWKAKWVTALRSGKYQQGKHVLKSPNNNFCCLGVLCDISGLGSWVKNNVKDSRQLSGDVYLVDNSSSYGDAHILPAEVKDLCGLATGNPPAGKYTVAEFNDKLDKSFTEIADLIEENL